jgi:hypothetical protein
VAAMASYSVIRSNSCSTHSILRGVDIQGAASEKLSRSKCTVVFNFYVRLWLNTVLPSYASGRMITDRWQRLP